MALLLVALMHFVRDDEDPAAVIATLRDALPSGSYLVLSHATADSDQSPAKSVKQVYSGATATLNPRSHGRILPFFDGFTLVDPGLTRVSLWRPDEPAPGADEALKDEAPNVAFYGGVGRKD